MGTVNLCTESPGFIMSPRISFSHNLYQNDVLQIESPHHQQQSHQHLRSDDSLLLEPNFDFCISSDSFIQESSSSADELFSDGKLLPLLLKQKLLPSPQQNSQSHYDPPPPATAAATVTTLETDSTNSSLETDSSTEPDCKEETITEKSSLSSSSSSSSSTASSNSKSFWGFKRSSSCGNGYKKSLICSLSILPRSNSTGSAPNLKSKETQKQKLQKSKSAYSSSSSGSSLSNSSSSSCQKPPLKKNYGGYNSINGGRMNPAHNVPPPYIPGNLFGLGSLFTSSNGKDKNRKK